jgi:hypothetical protein
MLERERGNNIQALQTELSNLNSSYGTSISIDFNLLSQRHVIRVGDSSLNALIGLIENYKRDRYTIDSENTLKALKKVKSPSSLDVFNFTVSQFKGHVRELIERRSKGLLSTFESNLLDIFIKWANLSYVVIEQIRYDSSKDKVIFNKPDIAYSLAALLGFPHQNVITFSVNFNESEEKVLSSLVKQKEKSYLKIEIIEHNKR